DDVVANAGNAASAKSGYFFTIAGLNAPPATVYNVVGLPSSWGLTGQKQFYADESGVVRYTSDGTVPTVASPPIQ
ncbi:MAG: hypothetical protein M3N22_09635, partial [Acidobacteriota bacterium]|nr:hypothetical protein [Acidobacteriota bacterium]